MAEPDHDLIRVDAGGWGLTWGVDEQGRLRQVGLGPEGHLAAAEVGIGWYPDALPTWGGGDPHRPAALRVTHADGTTSTRLVVEGVARRDVEGPGEHVVVALADEQLELRVEVHLRTHPGSGVLEQWIEVEHDQGGPVVLHDYDSLAAHLLIDQRAELCQFGGSGWADEWRWTTQRLVAGTLSLSSFGGVQPHLQRSPCALVSPFGPSTERSGDVLGVSVAWGGNVRIDLDVRPVADPGAPAQLRLRAGANPVGAHYVLDPGERFVAPVVAWSWSASGRGELTRRFHRWTRSRVVRDADRIRPLVVNNWEATFFDFDEQRIVELIGRAARLGADLFLLDDGWFGTRHPRDDDTTALGDWDHDPAKLPSGLAPLAAAAGDAGIRFGIWVEPEMVNPLSELHDAHPDWVLRDRRQPLLHRHQLVLDTLRDDVREFAAGVVDRALGQHRDITYVKWDANRPITDPGSASLAPDRQSNVWVDHALATWALMDEVVRRHPEVEMMLCASGGGRTDHGTLRRFHEFWTSDNTDPVARVRMQWACSHFFPACAMAAHVTRWGERPIEFACAVALSGRFGIDLDLSSTTEQEESVLRRAVELAHRTRELVQHGELVRLVSPVEGSDTSRASIGYLSEDGSRAVLFAYQLEHAEGSGPDLPLDWWNGGRGGRAVRTDLVDAPIEVELGEGATLRWPLSEACTAAIWELVARS